MSDLNQCNFIGRAGRDAEARFLTTGEPVTNFSIAVTWKGSKSGEQTEWISCTTFGKLAEIAGKYVTKGRQVYVSGRLRARKWTTNAGQEREGFEVVVDRLQLLAGGERSAGKPTEAEDDIPF